MQNAWKPTQFVGRALPGRARVRRPAAPIGGLPLNVEPVETDLSREETVQAVRESRERSAPGERPQ